MRARLPGAGQILVCADTGIRAALGIGVTTPLRVVAVAATPTPPLVWLRLPDGRETLIGLRYLTDPTKGPDHE